MVANREAGVGKGRASYWVQKRWLLWVGGGLGLGLAAAAGVLVAVAHRVEPFLRAQIVEELEQHFNARVELDEFHVSLADGLRAEGKGLRIWPPAQHPVDVDLSTGTPAQVAGVMVPGPGEPLIELDEFRFYAPLRYRAGMPIHIQVVELNGLRVKLPPKSHFGHLAAARANGGGLVKFEVEEVEGSGAELVVGTDKPGKLPLQIAIAHFKLTGIGSGQAMEYAAELTNPRPVGTIHASGRFGPWLGTDPGESALDGDYQFEHADLGGFKGIAGMMTSTGHYQGTLRDVVVDGEADVPDFRLTHFGNALPLEARFHAKVDGTNGDTWLEPVEATLGRSHFWAEGQIVRVIEASNGEPPHSIGHDIALTVNVDRARIEDFLRLASKGTTQLLTGDVTVKAKLHVPPGAAPVHERMTLKGKFAVGGARFTSEKIQGRIAELSLRGQGRPDEVKTTDPMSIVSTMKGSFEMGGGAIKLPALEFAAPGAKIDLAGSYGLEDGALDFTGTAKLDAPVSKIVGGWKGLLLTPLDRYLKKGGAGTEVPIHLEGTREAPKFGIDFGRVRTE